MMRYFIIISETYASIENWAIDRGVWLKTGRNKLDSMKRLHGEKGDKCVFWATDKRAFCLVAEIIDCGKNFSDYGDLNKIKLDEENEEIDSRKVSVIRLKPLYRINLEIDEINYVKLIKFANVNRNNFLKSFASCLQSFAKPERASLSEQDFRWIEKNSQPHLPVKTDSVYNPSLEEDWEKFASAVNSFLSKFQKHAYDYLLDHEIRLKFSLYEELKEKFEDYVGERDDEYRIDYEFRSESKNDSEKVNKIFDLSIYASKDHHINDVSIAIELKPMLKNNKPIKKCEVFEEDVVQEGNEWISDYEKLCKLISAKEHEEEIKSGIAVGFTCAYTKDKSRRLIEKLKDKQKAIIAKYPIGKNVKLSLISADEIINLMNGAECDLKQAPLK